MALWGKIVCKFCTRRGGENEIELGMVIGSRRGRERKKEGGGGKERGRRGKMLERLGERVGGRRIDGGRDRGRGERERDREKERERERERAQDQAGTNLEFKAFRR